ncbi:hypothetical protein LIN78_16740 [Leeia sp. TBRC 13508]|uniref:PepSY domain-containing protein n=1 Tax=Leeia speluncae TaxID=2884804 RepID=A0ABS8DAG7_9NEIS|nr:hypothetical protein [Leeia speluncae]MCB6185195.1 hypothetical protein [Leeia speluncae]
MSAMADLSRDDAARIAQQQTGGKVISVDNRSGGYRVKVLKDNGEIVILQLGNDSPPSARGQNYDQPPPSLDQRRNRPNEEGRGNNGNNNRRPFPFKDGF